MKKGSTAAATSKRNFDQKLTIGLDLGDRSSWYCVLDEAGEVISEQKLGTTPKAMKEVFAAIRRSLARLARIDPQLLSPVKHRSAQAQADLTVIRARASRVRARTALVNAARGLTKSYGAD